MKAKAFQSLLKKIGEGLTILRKKKGYDSISEFASDHSLPMIQYWRIEKGKANITLKSLARLLSIHELAPDEFFCSLKNSYDHKGSAASIR